MKLNFDNFSNKKRQSFFFFPIWNVLIFTATTLFAADSSPGIQRKPLVFAGKEKTRVTVACERAISLNLNGPATTGDVDQACECVNKAYAASEEAIPSNISKNYLYTRPEGEVIDPLAIIITSQAELVDGKVKIAANILAWEVRSCLGTLPTRDQLLDGAQYWKKDLIKPVYNYKGPLVSPISGPAKPIDKNLGGLLFVNLRHASYVIEDFTTLRDVEYSDEKYNIRNDAIRFMKEYGKGAEDYVVLSCKYRTEAKNQYNRWQATHAYYFWYKPKWTEDVAVLVGSAPVGHPIKNIGPPLDFCPLRKPE